MNLIIVVVLVFGALEPIEAAGPTVTPVRLAIEPFGYRGVTLTGGPLRRQVDSALEDYLCIPNDDLLKGFRRRAGKPAPGLDLGGWYSDDVFHVFGQILSGLARLYAATGDHACREKAEALVDGWAECIEPDGFFYYSRTPNAPHYIYDKMVGGLTDMVIYCESRPAADALAKITAWASKKLDRSNAYAFGGTEWYTLSENLYRAHRATGDPLYRDFAAVWHYNEYWNIYARKGALFGDRGGGRRTDVYHAYSHVNTLGGLAQHYLFSGDKQLLEALIYAHDLSVSEQCFPTGGFGPDEQLLVRESWLKKGDYSHNSFETQCGSFAVFKLCKYLLTITNDARFGDWIERLVYNGILATIPMSPEGHVFYYSDFNNLGGVKRNYPVGWSCCTGTRPMALADLHDLIYFHEANDVYVNLFVPSTLVWHRTGGPVTIRQRTRFPESESTELRIGLARPSTFQIKLRVPGWLARPSVITVNDRPVHTTVDAHGWLDLRREWRDGDQVTISLPMKFAVRPLDGKSTQPAMIMRGPVAMAVRTTGRAPSALLDGAGLESLLIPIKGDALTYRMRSNPDVLVRPFYALKQGEPYLLYLDPNRASHRAARFAGDGWRESEAFRFNDRPGASASFDFHGMGIRWIGYRFDDAGIAEIRIDGRLVAMVDQFGPRRGEPFEWRKDGLADGPHQLTISVVDRKADTSKGRFINVAGFEALTKAK